MARIDPALALHDPCDFLPWIGWQRNFQLIGLAATSPLPVRTCFVPRGSAMRVVPAMGQARNRRGMRAGRRHVLQISLAGPAPTADRRQTLFIGRKAAIGAAVAEEAAVIGAPRIIL